ncbi:MAG: MarR family winged helix-turn-helix transcriptional regulator [Georgenia sp.]
MSATGDPPSTADQRGTDVDRVLEQLVLYGRRVRHFGATVARACGLQPTQVYLLSLVHRANECRLTAIAEQQFVDPSVISRQIGTLERDGLLRRRPDPEDRRASLVSLTDLGRDRLARVRAAHLAVISETLQDWSTERIAQFAKDFEELTSTAETVYGRLATTQPLLPPAPPLDSPTHPIQTKDHA